MTKNDFVLALRDLRRTPGAHQPFRLEGSYDTEVVTGLVTLPQDRPVTVTGSLESAGDGVLVRAEATTVLDAQCSRCLRSFSYPVEVGFEELFVYPEHKGEAEDDQVSLIEADCVDLAGLVRDAVILDQPLIPLCRPDCPGLCPRCGADLTTDPDHSHEETVDERWLGLQRWGKMS